MKEKNRHWQKLKTRYKNEAADKNDGVPVCHACFGVNRLHLHHLTYKRRGKEKLGDLMLLCERCHVTVHQYKRQNKVSLREATAFVVIEQQKKNQHRGATVIMGRNLSTQRPYVLTPFDIERLARAGADDVVQAVQARARSGS